MKSVTEEDWPKVTEILKKPIFSFIELSITKQMKYFVMEKGDQAPERKEEESKKKETEEPDFT